MRAESLIFALANQVLDRNYFQERLARAVPVKGVLKALLIMLVPGCGIEDVSYAYRQKRDIGFNCAEGVVSGVIVWRIYLKRIFHLFPRFYLGFQLLNFEPARAEPAARVLDSDSHDARAFQFGVVPANPGLSQLRILPDREGAAGEIFVDCPDRVSAFNFCCLLFDEVQVGIGGRDYIRILGCQVPAQLCWSAFWNGLRRWGCNFCDRLREEGLLIGIGVVPLLGGLILCALKKSGEGYKPAKQRKYDQADSSIEEGLFYFWGQIRPPWFWDFYYTRNLKKAIVPERGIS